MTQDQRVGDAERDIAVAELREHASAGRLTIEEFEERMTKALEAKTRRDLTSLFKDLPRPPAVKRPAGPPQRRPARGSTALGKFSGNVGTVAMLVIWGAFLGAMMVGVMHWWMFWLPVIVTVIFKDRS